MSKLCPFMSKDMSQFNSDSEPNNAVSCISSCELYIENKCSIKILAEKAIYDYKKEKKQSLE